MEDYMFYYVLSGVLLAYFIMVIFAVIDKLLENNEKDDQEAW